MRKRVFLGSFMILIMSCLLYVDWYLGDNYKHSYLPTLPTAVVLLVLVIAGFDELSKLAMSCGCRLMGISGMIAAAALATYPYWSRLSYRLVAIDDLDSRLPRMAMLMSLALMAVFLEQMVRFRTRDAFRQVSATLMSVLYLGLGGMMILAIRTRGIHMLVLFLVTVKSTDIGAYFAGSAIGKHKLVPWLSPGKTWEGLVGGLVTGVAAAVIVALAFGPARTLTTYKVVAFAAIVGLAGQFADLCESLLKRSAGTKDSGAVVPEFGGVLDIIDSPLLAAPVAVLVLAVLI